MKTLDLSSIVENVRQLGAVKAFFQHMEDSYKQITAETFKGFLAGTATPVAVYGCVNSGNTTNYNISAGAIWNSGEVFTIAAFVGTASAGQVPRLTLQEQKVQLAYTDNTNHDTLITRTYVWVLGTTGSGLGDFSALGRLATIINNTLLDVDGQVAVPTAAVAAEAISRAAADVTLQNNIDSATGGLVRTIINLPSWNMQGVHLILITVGVPAFSKLRGVSAFVRNDTGDVYYNLLIAADVSWDNTPQILLAVAVGDFFDSGSFNNTGFSRGYLVIESIP